MTGRYPHSNGLMGLVCPATGWDLPASETTMPQYLKRAGYETHLFGMQHERKDASSLGYDRIVERTAGRRAAPEMAEAIASFLRGGPRQPFYLNFGIVEPHRRFGSADVDDPGDVYVPPYLPDDLVVRKEMAGFAKLVKRLDDGVGIVLDALDATGLAENTLAIFTTDHGIDMPRAKGTLYDPGIETALLMRWPGRIRSGTLCHELVSNVDLLPTLMEAVGLDVPEHAQGRRYLPMLEGKDHKARDAIFAEKTHHTHYDPMRCIRTDEHKYIFNFGALRAIEIPADAEMNTLESVPELYTTRRPMAELYDLKADPLEMNNICGSSEHQEIEEGLKRRLRAWMEETDDPLLDGIMPIPRFL